ncbi:MAG: DUF3800 domain-containing protein [Verrucomicrobiaceae bacterium]
MFIDESGDPGFKLGKGSSELFVLALVAFDDTEQADQTRKAIDQVSRQLRLPTEFKFSKSRPEVKDAFFTSLKPFRFRVRAIVIQKSRIYSPNLRVDKESFYRFFLKSMLSFDNGLLKDARLIMDGSGDREFKNELKVYLRRNLDEGAIKSFRFSDSDSDRLVQLADMCAGAVVN